MRIVAVDASADEARTERALAVALARAPERLLLFREAASAAARLAARDVDRNDERFLDVAAAWLLDGAPGDAPRRANLPVPLLEITIAVTTADHSPLVSAPRAVEMVGDKICMAVPDAAALWGEELDNANLWVVGGERDGRIDEAKGKVTLAPGDVLGDAGAVVVMDTGAGELKITRVDLDGRVAETRALSFTALAARMQVQGGKR